MPGKPKHYTPEFKEQGVHSSLKERAGVKRGFGLRFSRSWTVCRACGNGPVAPPFSAQVPCSCERASWVKDRAEPGRRPMLRR